MPSLSDWEKKTHECQNRLDFKLSEHGEHIVKNSDLIKSLMKHSMINARQPWRCGNQTRCSVRKPYVGLAAWAQGRPCGPPGGHPSSGILSHESILLVLQSVFSDIYWRGWRHCDDITSSKETHSILAQVFADWISDYEINFSNDSVQAWGMKVWLPELA